MKRNAIVSVCCALLFTNILLSTNAKDIEGFIGKCDNGDQKACRELKVAVEKLTDQALLAKIAVESRDADVRRAAVEKLTDQALLAKIAVEAQDEYVCLAAVEKLTDQPLLAKIAVDDNDSSVRSAAVGRLTDQAALAEIVVESKDAGVRQAAIGKLTDQALLAKIAIGNKDWTVREAAIERLSDQALLAKIAVEDKVEFVRGAAVRKLTDQALLAKVAVESENPVTRAEAIAAMDDSNPALRRLAGNLGELTSDDGESIARIRLAIQEPRIRSRFPGIVSATSVSGEYPTYIGNVARAVWGESVYVVLSQAGKVLAQRKWSPAFPGTISAGPDLFVPAVVRVDDLLSELLPNPEFTQDDLAELSSSGIPEVRQAAVRNLTDQAPLAKIAAEDKVWQVRAAAIQKLTDQELLAKIAVEDTNWHVREAAVKNLTDQALLAKIALEDKVPAVRRAAEQRLTQLRNGPE